MTRGALGPDGLDQVLAMRRDMAVPDDLARRIVVRTAVLPQHGMAGGAEHRPAPLPVPPARPAQRRSVMRAGALAASVALMLALVPQLQPSNETSGQGPARSLPQVAAADLPAANASAQVQVSVTAQVGGRSAPKEGPAPALALANTAAAPAVMAQAPDADGTAPPVGSPPAEQAEPWRAAARPVTFALSGTADRPEIYGPVLDPQSHYGFVTTRANGTAGLGIGESAGGAAMGGGR